MKEDVADQLRVLTMERAAETVKRAIQGYVARKRYEAMKRTLAEDASVSFPYSCYTA